MKSGALLQGPATSYRGGQGRLASSAGEGVRRRAGEEGGGGAVLGTVQLHCTGGGSAEA